MNFALVGRGDEYRAIAAALASSPDHRVVAIWSGATADLTVRSWFPEAGVWADYEEVIAVPEVEAVVLSPDPPDRPEFLRRAVQAGRHVLAMHPADRTPIAYYEAAMIQQDTGVRLTPVLPFRLLDGFRRLAALYGSGPLGAIRSVELDHHLGARPGSGPEPDLIFDGLARSVDSIRALIGEIGQLTAAGDRGAEQPRWTVTVQLRSEADVLAQVRVIAGGDGERLRWTVRGVDGAATLELDPAGTARLVYRDAAGDHHEESSLAPAWPLLIGALVSAEPSHPDWSDATRSLELADGVARSLRRGRTIEMVYEEVSEEASFKSVMTALGCGLLWLVLVLVIGTAAGLALGIGWARYIGWFILPILVLFLLLQVLRLVIVPRSKNRTD